MKADNRFYNVADIMSLCGISRTHAYQLIREWNKELLEQGFTVAKRGLVSRAYAEKRLGIAE